MSVFSCFCPPLIFYFLLLLILLLHREGADWFLSCLGRCTLSTPDPDPALQQGQEGDIDLQGVLPAGPVSKARRGRAPADHLGGGTGRMDLHWNRGALG